MWYQYYFATERAVGYEKPPRVREAHLALLRQNGLSTMPRLPSAASLDNPDHVAITVHNYRWRLALAAGEARYDPLEARLATAPTISVPTITMESDANGAPHPAPAAYARKFSGRYSHRTITGGVGHNLPQEAPQAFAQAVIDVNAY